MTPQYGPHRWSAGYHDDGHNGDLQGTRFAVADLSGARFVDCDLGGVRVIDGWLVDVQLSGYVDGLLVNGVDVTGYVRDELDRRHPERVQLRAMAGADDSRAVGMTLERVWADTVVRARRLPEPALHERIGEEWSFVETLRHLVFIVDSWASRTILDAERPFHPLALPQTAYRPADATALGMRIDARPSLDEVLAAWADRTRVLRGILDPLTDADLGRGCDRTPAPGYPQEQRPVADCLAVVFEEQCEHHRFAVRDLALLEQRAT